MLKVFLLIGTKLRYHGIGALLFLGLHYYTRFFVNNR
jgi:hypothetical protein